MLQMTMSLGDSSFHGLPTGTTYEEVNFWESKDGVRHYTSLSGQRCTNGFFHRVLLVQLSNVVSPRSFEVIFDKSFRKEEAARKKLRSLVKGFSRVEKDPANQPQWTRRPPQ